MTLFPLMECCQLLAIDPKTLRRWLQQAAISVHVHPMDGRRKCLAHEQVQQLAVLHDRILKPEQTPLTASLVELPALGAQLEPTDPHPISNAGLVKTAVVLDDEQLRQKLSQAQAQVVAQQQQLILLTRDLLRERATRTERRLSPPDPHAPPQGGPEILGSQHENLTISVPHAVRPLHPAEQRARFLLLPPLIEYSAAGTYVVISSQEGEIPLLVDSLEWFDWFRTLSSFRGCRERRATLERAVAMIVVQHVPGMLIGPSISMSTDTIWGSVSTSRPPIWSRWQPDSNPTCSRSL